MFPETREQMAGSPLDFENSPDLRQRRQDRLDWWSPPGRGVEIHDMLRLPCDQDALKVLLAADDVLYTPR